jgi:hypothetical protein
MPTRTRFFSERRRRRPTAGSRPITPPTGTMPTLCREYGNPLVRRHFDRDFHLERGRQEREEQAVQAYTTQMENQQARAAANRAAIEATDVKINALNTKTQAAAAAQKFAEIEALNHQMEALMKQKSSLMGIEEGSAQEASIEAEATRDTEATFSLWFEAPTSEPRSGKPYRTAVGRRSSPLTTTRAIRRTTCASFSMAPLSKRESWSWATPRACAGCLTRPISGRSPHSRIKDLRLSLHHQSREARRYARLIAKSTTRRRARRGTLARSIFRSSASLIAVARPAPNTPPPGCWKGPTR